MKFQIGQKVRLKEDTFLSIPYNNHWTVSKGLIGTIVDLPRESKHISIIVCRFELIPGILSVTLDCGESDIEPEWAAYKGMLGIEK